MKDGLMQEYISKLQKLAVDYPLTESTSKYLDCGIREFSEERRQEIFRALDEIYSREGDHTDYLAGIDLESPRNNAERDYLSEEAFSLIAWDCGDWLMRLDCDWEMEIDGKTYLYVASNFNYTGWPQYDLLLTIFEEGDGCMEAVKVYYLAAHYRLSLDNEECGVDGSW